MNKAIVIKDIGKPLSAFPRRKGMRSPIHTAIKLDVSVIAALMHRDRCNKIYELHPEKFTEADCPQVLLTKENYDKPWDEIYTAPDTVEVEVIEEEVEVEIEEEVHVTVEADTHDSVDTVEQEGHVIKPGVSGAPINEQVVEETKEEVKEEVVVEETKPVEENKSFDKKHHNNNNKKKFNKSFKKN